MICYDLSGLGSIKKKVTSGKESELTKYILSLPFKGGKLKRANYASDLLSALRPFPPDSGRLPLYCPGWTGPEPRRLSQRS